MESFLKLRLISYIKLRTFVPNILLYFIRNLHLQSKNIESLTKEKAVLDAEVAELKQNLEKTRASLSDLRKTLEKVCLFITFELIQSMFKCSQNTSQNHDNLSLIFVQEGNRNWIDLCFYMLGSLSVLQLIHLMSLFEAVLEKANSTCAQDLYIIYEFLDSHTFANKHGIYILRICKLCIFVFKV